MAPRFLVDSERPLRNVVIQDQFRFWLTFKLKGYQYKRWFASAYERNCYRDFQVSGAEIVDSGELPKRLDP